MLGRVKPAVVVGFGGYPTVPPLMAASLRGIADRAARAERRHGPRQPAVGIARHGDRHRLSHACKNLDAALQAKVTFTGNPVRREVIAAAAAPYAAPAPAGKLRLVMFGGSQGARVMAEIVPEAVELIPAALLVRLSVVQQARAEDVDGRTRRLTPGSALQPNARRSLPICRPAWRRRHLVISRSGASTVAELSAIGRPAILVPLPHSLDQDQFVNAGVLAEAGGALRIEQRDFTPERLAAEIAGLAGDPGRLSRMAAAAKSAGTIDAAERLADVVMKATRPIIL